jgi:hypothetical protein
MKYGHMHRRLRAALLQGAYGRPCIHCGHAMLPGQRLHLDHTADGTAYRGIVHGWCNESEAGRRGSTTRRSRRHGVFAASSLS